MVIRDLLQETVNALKNNNIDNAVFEANLMLRKAFGLSPLDLVLAYNDEAGNDDVNTVKEFVNRRIAGEPLQYILGVWEFMGLELEVNKDVLIPRADTEILVEKILLKQKGISVLDICTGSGCIGLSIAHYNKNAFVTGIDISENALKIAKRNADRLKLNDRVSFIRMDIMSTMPYGVFDIIVSNPPYIVRDEIDNLQNEIKFYEPRIALDGGKDGLDFYRRIIEIAPTMLQENGELYFEVGYNQANAVRNMMKPYFKNIETVKDLCGEDRVVGGVKI